MKMRIQVIIEDESGLTTTAEIAAIERRLSTDLIGISLEEAKAMTGSVQRVMVETQAREAIDRGSRCPECQLRFRRNGLHRIRYRTPFGRLDLDSPRFYRCLCGSRGRQSISPLAPAAVSTSRWLRLLSRSMKRSGTNTIYSSLGRLTAGSNPDPSSRRRSRSRALLREVILLMKNSMAQPRIRSGWRKAVQPGRRAPARLREPGHQTASRESGNNTDARLSTRKRLAVQRGTGPETLVR
jgi:hypothetical protein